MDGRLEVLCQAPIAPDPGEEPFDNPTPWLNGEADLIGVLAHDLDGNQRGLSNLLTRVSAVGEDPLDERENATRSSQKGFAAIAILDARRMRFEHEATPIRIDEGMALTPVDLFPGIVAARLGDLEAELEQLTVNTRRAPKRVRTADLANERA